MRRAPRALAIAVWLLAASCTPLGSGDAPASPPVVPGSRFAALWPERSLGAALRTQAAVDAGSSSMRWRLSPTTTARRFASQVLGWDGALVVKGDTWTLSSGIDIARVWLCDADGCPPSGAAFDEEIILKRLAGAGGNGVWSVTDVTSGRILLDEGPAIRIRDPFLRAGKRLDAITTDLPDGLTVLAGSTSFGPCGRTVDATRATFRFSYIRFQVATDLDAGCARVTRPAEVTPGYVFVLPRERGLHVDPGRLFTEPRQPGSAPILDLTAIAVRFLPRSEMPPPPAAWLSRDPKTLPWCTDDQLVLGPIHAGEALTSYAVGIWVDIARRYVPACHARLFVHLSLSDGHGAPIEVPGRHRLLVDAYLPGYVPGRRTTPTGWMLSNWCGRDVTGPVRVRISGAGRSLELPSDQLAMWCPVEADGGYTSGPAKLLPIPG